MLMIESGQIWQHNLNHQQIRICKVDNKIVVAEQIPVGGRLFTTIFALRAEYQRTLDKTGAPPATFPPTDKAIDCNKC
jgi:hypothetical protein